MAEMRKDAPMKPDSNAQNKNSPTSAGRQRRSKRTYTCHACGRTLPFCWNCQCGFAICDDCMKENQWGMSNGPTWICPDCERIHMF